MRPASRRTRINANGLVPEGPGTEKHSESEGGEVILKAEQWRSVVDALPEPISVHNPDGLVLQVNTILADLYAATPDGLKGRSCEEVFHTEGALCPHKEAVSTAKIIQLDGNASIGGRMFNVAVHPLIDDSQRVVGYLRIMRESTGSRHEMSKLLIAERYATLGQMVAGIAHDVGTPLNIISGYSEYLLMRSQPGDQGYKELSTILKQSRRIAEFIRRVLDLARPAEGRTDAIGLEGFLAESLELAGHHLRKSEVKASLVYSISPPLIYGDAPRLRQALVIILLNARLMTGRGGAIEIAVDQSDNSSDFVRLSVRGKDGEGRPLDLSQLWSGLSNQFIGEDAAGLGLTLARAILTEFGANIVTGDGREDGGPLVIDLPRNPRAPSGPTQ